MNKERKITIYKENKSIEFINNGIAFSQFGIANEILDLIIDIQLENEKLHKVLDKIKEHLLNYIEEWQDSEDEYVKGKIDLARDVLCDIEELLEEIE